MTAQRPCKGRRCQPGWPAPSYSFVCLSSSVIVTEKTNILLRYLHQQWDKKVRHVEVGCWASGRSTVPSRGCELGENTGGWESECWVGL